MEDLNSRSPYFRSRPRQQSERRQACRRRAQYSFGSEQWINHVKQSYAFWPNQDRRQQERRSISRRNRTDNRNSIQAQQRALRQQLSSNKEPLLTAEERQMLNDLNKP